MKKAKKLVDVEKCKWVGDKCGIVSWEEQPGDLLPDEHYTVGDSEDCCSCNIDGCFAYVREVKVVKELK
jgi:hypothetical protein